MAALLMAVYLRGLDDEETASLTEALAESGEQLPFAPADYVDKHSTGGVGDTVTLVAGPWAAACGVHIAKLSGRSLGFTGGTIDKLASIPGLRLSLPASEIRRVAEDAGWAIAQADTVAPADKYLYALRDATCTVESIPLITASVLSKKFAMGAPSLVFEVTYGSGAFLKSVTEARFLAERLIATSRGRGRAAAAVLVNMEQPLGNAVGNALEIEEALKTLEGKGPTDLTAASRAVAAAIFELAFPERVAETESLLQEALGSGEARKRFNAMAELQGAEQGWEERLPRAAYTRDVIADCEGVIARLDAYAVARAAGVLGANRENKTAPLDAAAGIILHKKVGDPVAKGEPILTLHTNNPKTFDAAEDWVRRGIEVGHSATGLGVDLTLIR